ASGCLTRPPSPQARPRVLCPQVAAAAGERRFVGRRPCGHRAAGSCPCGRLPLQVATPRRGPWPKSVATTGGLVMVDRPCRVPGRGPLPLSLLPLLRKHYKNA
ncbi:hypothetical protein BHE74_00055913, partial [Ensete ventricosum]